MLFSFFFFTMIVYLISIKRLLKKSFKIYIILAYKKNELNINETKKELKVFFVVEELHFFR